SSRRRHTSSTRDWSSDVCSSDLQEGETMPLRPGFDVVRFNRFGKDFLPGFVGLVITEVSEGLMRGELELRKALLAPNGYLHAGEIGRASGREGVTSAGGRRTVKK